MTAYGLDFSFLDNLLWFVDFFRKISVSVREMDSETGRKRNHVFRKHAASPQVEKIVFIGGFDDGRVFRIAEAVQAKINVKVRIE